MTTQNFQYTKISELAETTRTDNDSLLVVNVGGETKKITFSNLKTLITQAIVQSLTTIYERLGILETAVSSLLRRMNNAEDFVNDFDIDNPTDGQVLKYDATEEKWVNGSDGGTSALANLTDVDLDNVANGQILKYNSTTQKWENANESGGGSGAGLVLTQITGGDNTSSRTFSFSSTPKRITVSYDSADSTPWLGHWDFIWGDDYAYGFASPKGIPGQVGLTGIRCQITYGADGKSFTITGGNAFQAWNLPNSVRGGLMLIDYGGSGGGSSYTETVLYDGLFSTNTELELSDDIGNYNALIIWVGWTSTSANGKVPFMVDVTTFKTFPYVANPTVATDHIFCFLFSNNQYLRIARASVDTKLRLFDTQSGAVERVIGIKY